MKKTNLKVVATAAALCALLVGGGTVLAMGNTGGNQLQQDAQGEISEQQAKEAVLAHAGIAESDVTRWKIQLDREDGIPVYDVDFTTATHDYDYDVNRNTGEIVKFSSEVREGDGAETIAQETGSTAGTASGSGTADTSTSNGASGTITKDEAKAIALEHAGVAEADTQFLWVKADREDGVPVYEVEFYANGTEYDYDILQSTGAILKYDYDVENFAPSTGSGSSSTGAILSREDAIALALEKVSGATSQNIHIELDQDDGRQVYEGEIHYNQMEYEFEIDASTGTFLEWSVEHWD